MYYFQNNTPEQIIGGLKDSFTDPAIYERALANFVIMWVGYKSSVIKNQGNGLEGKHFDFDEVDDFVKESYDELSAEGKKIVGEYVDDVGSSIKNWNDFQSATKGMFSNRSEAAAAWNLYKTQNGIVTGTIRNMAERSAFLNQFMESGKAPSWMNQWLQKGLVPPGYQVDHIVPLSIGGADTASNMRLLLTKDHIIWHTYYYPWR